MTVIHLRHGAIQIYFSFNSDQVTDFGLSIEKDGVGTDSMMEDYCGTPMYMCKYTALPCPICRSSKVSCGKTADWIRMPFGVVRGVGRGIGVLGGVHMPKGKGRFRGGGSPPII